MFTYIHIGCLVSNGSSQTYVSSLTGIILRSIRLGLEREEGIDGKVHGFMLTLPLLARPTPHPEPPHHSPDPTASLLAVAEFLWVKVATRNQPHLSSSAICGQL